MKLIFPLAMLLTIICVSSARADDEEAAREAFQKARVYFKAGHYESAIKLLEAAYKFKPHPALLRYMAQTYFKMNKAVSAIKYFKRYLKEAPQAPDKEEVMTKIRELELIVGSASEEEEVTKKPIASVPKPLPPSQETKPPKTSKKLSVDLAPTGEDAEDPFKEHSISTSPNVVVVGSSRRSFRSGATPWTYVKWGSVGTGVAGLALGITFAVLSSSRASEAQDMARRKNPNLDNPGETYPEDIHNVLMDYQNFRTISILSFVVAGVAAGGTLTGFLMDDSGSSSRTAVVDDQRNEAATQTNSSRFAVTPMFGNGSLGLMGQGSF